MIWVITVPFSAWQLIHVQLERCYGHDFSHCKTLMTGFSHPSLLCDTTWNLQQGAGAPCAKRTLTGTSGSGCFYTVFCVPWEEACETLPELCVTSWAPLAWPVCGQLSALAVSAWRSALLLCRPSEGRKNSSRSYWHAQRYKWGQGWPFSLPKNLRREVFCLCHGCVKSQASVGKGVHSAVSSNFRIKSGVKKHLSQLQSCDFMSSHPCLPLLYETPSQRSKQFLFSLIFTSQ